jgi:hypothetical protein
MGDECPASNSDTGVPSRWLSSSAAASCGAGHRAAAGLLGAGKLRAPCRRDIRLAVHELGSPVTPAAPRILAAALA